MARGYAAEPAVQRLAQDPDLACRRPHESGEDSKQRRLAGPVRSHYCQGLTLPE